MTDPSTTARLEALQRSRQTSAARQTSISRQEPRQVDGGNTDQRNRAEPRPRTTSRSGSGTKWTLAGGAVGASLTLMGAMAAGQGLAAEQDPPVQPAAAAAPAPQIIVVVSQPGAAATAGSSQAIDAAPLADLTQSVNEAVAELPEPVPQENTASTAKRTESGGS